MCERQKNALRSTRRAALICTMKTMDPTIPSAMDQQLNEIELVEQSKRGDRQSLNTLAGIARNASGRTCTD